MRDLYAYLVAAQAGRPFNSRYLAVSDPLLTIAAKNAGFPLQETRDPRHFHSVASLKLNGLLLDKFFRAEMNGNGL